MESVTGLLKLLHKEGLLYWSNKIGLEGTSLKDYRNKSSKKGTKKHNEVENYLVNGVKFNDSYKLDKCLEGYTIEDIEFDVDNGFINGRCDLMLSKGSEVIIVDFKSSGKVYLDQKIQLSAYAEMTEAKKIAIINFNNWELEFLNIDTKKYFNILRHLYVIKTQIRELNERI